MTESGSPGTVANALAEVWRAHRGEALARVDVLEDAAAALAAGDLGPGQREEARRAAHKLRGSAGTFGFHRATELAGELEDLFSAEGPIPQAKTPEIASTVLALRSELAGAPSLPGADGESPQAELSLLVVSGDAELGRRLTEAASSRPVRVGCAVPDEAAERAAREHPDIVLADLAGPADRALDVLGELTAGGHAAPVLALAGSGALVDRVEAVRRGARGFIDRASGADRLIDAAERWVAGLRGPPATVLAVDDDPSVLATLRALLEARGHRVETLADPKRFWERLEEVAPELVILDLDMPDVNGFELCEALRADPSWAAMPVLIVTAYREPEVIRRAFVAGADDYLVKPIIEEEIAGRVRNRVERVRAYREGTGRDDLTGVATRRAAIAELERLIRHARGAGEPLSLALVGLDGLRSVNEARGLAAGDAVLRRVGAGLRGELAAAALGRWDGDEFVIGLNGMGADDAARRLRAILDGLEGEDLGLTVSAGVGCAVGDSIDLPRLVAAADRALAEAKRGGGGKVVTAGPGGEPSGERVDVAIVEDDDSVVDVLALALETLGLSSRRFADGTEAAAALAGRRRGDPPPLATRLVLLDWDLPGLDGLSVLRRIADTGGLARTTVIMLTARANEQETLKALELGASDYVAKPFSVPVLAERIRRALER